MKQKRRSTTGDYKLRRTLGWTIIRLRQRQEWTQAELAEALGVSRGCVTKWESGEHAPALGMLARVAAVLCVSLEELITGKPEAAPLVISPSQRRLLLRMVNQLSAILGESVSDSPANPSSDAIPVPEFPKRRQS